jgi:hypothetical protein
MSSTASVEQRSRAVQQLRQALTDAPLRLDTSGADRARNERTQLLDQIDDYLLPRLAQLDAPLVAVLGGSTGAGKSTLFNSILGDAVSAASVRRPTTRTPVLACHIDDQQWFTSDRVLPGLERTAEDDGSEHRPGTLRIHPTTALPPGLALLDAPDIDSVETANRSLAEQLLAAADLWVFVTTAARYADAIPWEVLSTAAERGTVVALVLNRVPPGARDDVSTHLTELMHEAGLGSADLFVIDEGPKSDAGLLTGDDLTAVAGWVRRLAADADARAAVAQRTLDGALASLLPRTRTIAEAVHSELEAADRLSRDIDDAYEAAAEAIAERAIAGRALHTEVLGRWHELVGTGKIIGTVQRQVGRVRDAVAGAFGRRSETAAATGELTSELERGITLHADEASLAVVEQWRDDPAGAGLLGGDDVRLSRSDPDLAIKARAEIDQWSASVVALVSDQGKNRQVVARVLSIGVNTVGLALMVAVFAHTGGLTGGEVVVASGTGAASHALLTAVFGEQAVRDLVEQARGDLEVRIRRLLADDATRFRQRLAADAATDDIAADLDAAIDLLSESLT